jgi:hypothetical protein
VRSRVRAEGHRADVDARAVHDARHEFVMHGGVTGPVRGSIADAARDVNHECQLRHQSVSEAIKILILAMSGNDL